jgi:hypothetical protein
MKHGYRLFIQDYTGLLHINDCSRSRPCPCNEIFASLILTVNFYRCHCHFFDEKCGDENFIYFFLINDWIQNYWVVQFNSCVWTVCTYLFTSFWCFFMWSGNHKFYIQFLRLLGLQSFIITLYCICQFWPIQTKVKTWRV